jgi:PAS domain S-box-containing protein
MANATSMPSDHQLLELMFQQSLDGLFFMMLDEPIAWNGKSDDEKVSLLNWVCGHHRITRINQAMLRQYGGTPDQILGMTPGRLFAHDRDEGRRVWREFFDRGRLHIVTRERRVDGTPIVIEGDYLCIYDDEGRITGHFGVQRDVTEEVTRQETLERSERQLRGLAERLETIREEERTRIAREIHDELGQALTALKFDVAWVRNRQPRGNGPLIERTDVILARVDETMATVRRIATELRPSILDNMGLAAAIEWQAEEFSRRTGIEVDLTVALDTVSVDDSRTTPIFRILQEALTNVARHSAASRVTIECAAGEDGVELVVADNGRGISPQHLTSGRSLGLIGLRERARASGGWIEIEGQPGIGTRVVARIPAPPPPSP